MSFDSSHWYREPAFNTFQHCLTGSFLRYHWRLQFCESDIYVELASSITAHDRFSKLLLHIVPLVSTLRFARVAAFHTCIWAILLWTTTQPSLPLAQATHVCSPNSTSTSIDNITPQAFTARCRHQAILQRTHARRASTPVLLLDTLLSYQLSALPARDGRQLATGVLRRSEAPAALPLHVTFTGPSLLIAASPKAHAIDRPLASTTCLCSSLATLPLACVRRPKLKLGTDCIAPPTSWPARGIRFHDGLSSHGHHVK